MANTRRPSAASPAAPVARPVAAGMSAGGPCLIAASETRSVRCEYRLESEPSTVIVPPAGQLAADGAVEIERDPARRILDEAAVAGLERAERGRQDAPDRHRCAVGHRSGLGDRDRDLVRCRGGRRGRWRCGGGYRRGRRGRRGRRVRRGRRHRGRARRGRGRGSRHRGRTRRRGRRHGRCRRRRRARREGRRRCRRCRRGRCGRRSRHRR